MILGKNIIAVNQSKEMLDLLFDLEFKIMKAKDCIDCIRQTIRYRPDLVIAEISSPHLNGLSMARILNTLMIRTPIILTSADLKYRSHALSFSNVNGFLLNPVQADANHLDKTRKALEAIVFNVDKMDLEPVEFAYSFRQREWANLIGKSGKPKILVIEDDKSVKFSILKLLDSIQSYDLFNADDGLAGVFKALLVEPDLILTDISMPNLDGLAMCQIFNILNKPFPVAFITSINHKEIPEKALKSQGVVGLMNKSVLQNRDNFIEQFRSFYEQGEILRKRWKQTLLQTSKSAVEA